MCGLAHVFALLSIIVVGIAWPNPLVEFETNVYLCLVVL